MSTHLLKTWPGEWEATASGAKRHEVRKADRDFKVGDTLILAEWSPGVYEHGLNNLKPVDTALRKIASDHAFTGRRLMRTITYVTKAGSWDLPDDVCILSIK